jgi:hypothetical protein
MDAQILATLVMDKNIMARKQRNQEDMKGSQIVIFKEKRCFKPKASQNNKQFAVYARPRMAAQVKCWNRRNDEPHA